MVSLYALPLLQIQRLHVRVGLEAVNAVLNTDTAVLVATECGVQRHLKMGIHPHTTSLELPRNAVRLLDVVRPNGRAKSHEGVIGTVDNLGFFGPLHDWKNGA